MAGSHSQQYSPSVYILRLTFLCTFALLVCANEPSLSLDQNTTLQLPHGLPVGNSPGSKSGTTLLVQRVRICGLSRFRNLRKFAHSMKVKVLPANSNVRVPNIEICFHRNASLAVGMCPQGQWEKVSKGSWARSLSPFDNKLLDIRTAGSTLENFEVSVDEEFFAYRIIFLILGLTLMSLASFVSKSLAFYYSTAMAIGIILVILMILYQGMKLLPTGRKSSLAIFLYASAVGFGTFLLQYVPDLLRSVLTELGIGEDMYNPLAIFLLAFVAIAGAWMGFWVVHKLILTEEGSVDISTAQFVAWAIRIVAAIMILQSSVDPLLGTLALLCGSLVSLLKRLHRLRFLRRLRRNLFKSPTKNRRSQVPDSPSFDDSLDKHMYKMQIKNDSSYLRPQSKSFTPLPCKSSERGFGRTPPKKLSEDLYPSIIHTTPERRKYSAAEWDAFTKESTEKALVELAASPDFGRWLSSNADRVSVTPNSRTDGQRRWWLLWW
ncbi:PREDICTED: nuclear envelope integral membrane protein 1 isoform X1 [Lupinus angustifolius]|uniref:nuclear envelope integral membrane protein 1 isoform X1 n=1 Tax=Lupinus angustifolius TaxID=3871 RepID=UPI00092F106C|nr:PREDICTED: nuclear envelope integral membrane protein 1 isoform X1 [Lupinus angustifolius]XP_019444932.1 PREDICTED: nuclear envelope integral membrane protein 1 isoform X1 [Lupinus angustifolius]